MAKPPPKERFCYLEWFGPYAYGPNGLVVSGADPNSRSNKKALHGLINKPGFYAIYGDHPIYGNHALLYIGKSLKLNQRLKEQWDWIKWEWRIEIYLAAPDNPKALNDAEKLLIYAHSPPYNSQNIRDVPRLDRHLRIWNDGKSGKLFPELSSAHPWYEPY